MAIDEDLKEIYDIFFEESAEGLEVMETGLLSLDFGAADLDTINDIFRAAHSIKGGAGTFGFMEVSSFTHGVETIMDQMRDGKRDVTEENVQLLLESVDFIGTMLEGIKNDEPDKPEQRKPLEDRIHALLADSGEAPAAPKQDAEQPAPAPAGQKKIWKISFAPSTEILRTGNDPVLLFKELKSLGDLTVKPKLSNIPDFDELDPEELHISWLLQLESDCTESQISDVFTWVEGQCDLDISSDDALETAAESESSVEAEKPAAKPKAAKPANADKASTKSRESASIRVAIDKVDSLLNLVGELVITQSMLRRFGDSYDPDSLKELRDGLSQLERHTRELQESAMQIRMLPINSSFNRFPRLVRDLSTKLGKKIDLVVSGEHTEVDKTVLEKLNDPLVHLVRNSLDHGIEMPDVRVSNGKPETGTLHLSAAHEGGNVIIKVEDDGAGLNREKILAKAIQKGIVQASEELSDERIDNLIFQAGFSTADQVSDVSGRGVGMDVVRRNILDLGGRIRVQSNPGAGTSLRISLPLTLAILDGQLVRISSEVYVISVLSIIESVQLTKEQIKTVSGSGDVFKMRDQYIPVVRATDAFGIEEVDNNNPADILVIVESENVKFGILVNELLEQQQIVIKSIENNYKKVPGLTGATILGDGRVALILDVAGFQQTVDRIKISRDTPQLAEAA
jgi:two-component system chemotaxis sensor kinase CheA